MAISQKKYVDITSRFPVAGSVERILGGLVFTKATMSESASAELLPKKRAYDAGELVALEYEDAKSLFGSTSAEALFANNYNGYASPNGYVPCSLKFARVMSTNVPVYKSGTAYAANDYVEYHGDVYKFTSAITAENNLYFLGARSNFATAIAAYATSGYESGVYFTNTADSTTSVYKTLKSIDSGKEFSSLVVGTDINLCDVTAYATGTSYSVGAVVSYTATASTTYHNCTANLLPEDNQGWEDCCSVTKQTSSLPTYVYESASDALSRIDSSDNAFGSFTFLDSSATLTFTDAELKAVTALNSGYSTRYLACVARKKGTGQTASTMVAKKNNCVGDGATGCVFVQGATDVSAYMPMVIFAATDYDNGAQVPCHMYKQFGNEDATVFNDDDYTTLSDGFVNFYGQSQSNGKRINFYQRGFNTDGTDTSIYCNEVWFKSRCLTRLMNMFIGNERVPANNEGLAMVAYEVSEVCNLATVNGTFMPKDVSADDEVTVRQMISRTGGTAAIADEALKSIANVGYYVWTYLNQDPKEYKIGYYVLYGTADIIRFVKGDDVLVK